ncbi:MAG: discoidin domain-containing protein, partial [Pyrinomonadaceae bacterium]
GGWSVSARYDIVKRDGHADFDYLLPLSNEGPENQRLSQYSWWKFMVRTPDGAEHELVPTGSGFQVYGGIDYPRSYLWGFHTAFPTAATGPVRYETVDGTFISAVYNPPGHTSGVNWTIFLPDGTQVIDFSSGVQQIRDTNGNTISIYSDGTGTHYRDDHTNREIRIEDVPGGAGGYGQTRIWYQTVGGGWQHVDANHGATEVRGKIYKVNDWNPTAGSVCTHQQQLPSQTIDVVREIVFPQTEPNVAARRFSFSYNSDSGQTETATTQQFQDVCGQSPVTYTREASRGMGALSRMVTPTGAQVDYTYTLTSVHDFTGLVGTDRLTRETLAAKDLTHDGVTEHWAYDIPYDGVGTTSTVTNPDGSTSTVSYYQRHPDNPRGFGTGDLLAGQVFYESNGLTQTHRRWAMRGTTYATGTDGYTAMNPYVEAEYTTLMEGSVAVRMSAKTYEYDYNGNTTKVTEYDWFDPASVQREAGTGIPTGVPSGAKVLRVTETNYHNQAGSATSLNYYRLRPLTTFTPSILNAVKETTLGASRTRFSYDGQAYGVAPSAGNVTQVSRRDDKGDADAGNDTEVTTSTAYGDYGNPASTTDANLNVTNFSYDDPTHALPTRVVVNPLNGTGAQTTATTYDPSTGLVTSVTDPNNQVTTVDYTNGLLGAVDPFGRPGMTRSPAGTDAGGATVYRKSYTYYYDAARQVRTATDLNTEGDGLLKSQTTTDELGRVLLAEQNEGSTSYTISSRTVYALAGRVTLQSSPVRGSTPESWTRVTKDVYGRVIEAATFGGSTQPSATAAANQIANWTGSVTTLYAANTTTVTDQAGRKRRSVSDALGRLVRVDEPDKDSGALDDSGGNPVQPTTYTYDALNNLRKVEQGGQFRFFMYDSLGRLVRAKNPEQGSFTPDTGTNPDFPALTDTSTGAANSNSQWATGYKYDAGGNLSKRKDARGVVTVYGYDGLNRNTTITYTTTGSGAASTPNVVRTYDGATLGKGRLQSVAQSGTSTSATYIDAYDATGRPLTQRQKFETNGAAYTVTCTYDLAGNLKTQTYPSGHSVTYTYDGAGRLNGFTGNLGGGGAVRTYSDAVTYDAAGRMSQERFGTDTPLYNKHLYNSRGQLAEIRLGTAALPDGGWQRGAIINHYSASGWGASGGGPDNNGNLRGQDVFIPKFEGASYDQAGNYDLFSQGFDYDALNRLTRVQDAAGGQTRWAQVYDYDRWGNRTINAAATQVFEQNVTYTIPEPQFAVNQNTNQLGVPSGQAGQMIYDPAGNLVTDSYQGGQNGGGTRIYDAENRMTSAQFLAGQTQTAAYVYDAEGRRVKRMVATSSEVWQVYGVGGELLAEYAPNASPNSALKEYGYRGGELLVTASPTTTQAVAPVNLAQGKTTSQSSTYTGTSPNGDSWRAVDGNTNGAYFSGSVTHTNIETNPWWQVDLGAVQSLGNLDLWNRTDCCADRLSNFYVFVSDVPFTSTDPAQTQAQSGVWSYYLSAQAATRTTLPVNRTGRYVRVQIASAGAVLSLAEVQVWGTQNLSAGKATAQSSTFSYNPPGDAWHAVDGNTDGNYMAGSVTHTNTETRPWWQVDLSAVRALDRIEVWNRTDCCAERLTDFYVLVSDTPFTSTDLDMTLGQAGVSAYRTTGQGGRPTTVQVSRTGRYVRVQLASASAGVLSLAEVKVWGADTLTSAQGSADVRWLVTDQLGTPRMVVDRTGSLAGVTRHDYLPFGEELYAGTGGRTTAQGYSAANNVRQRFTGYERDDETDLDFAEARYYTSMKGRFMSADPYNIVLEVQADAEVDSVRAQEKLHQYLAAPQQWNRYAYVNNNPLRYVDPSGEKLELTGTAEDIRIGFERLQKLVGAEAAGYLTLAQERDRDGNLHTFVDYVGGDKMGATGEIASAIAAIIDHPDTLEFKVTSFYPVGNLPRVNIDSENGGGVTIPRTLSRTGNVQIFVSPSAGLAGTAAARNPNFNPNAIDIKPDAYISTNDTIDAHEFGHGFAYLFRLQQSDSEPTTQSVLFENFQRSRHPELKGRRLREK